MISRTSILNSSILGLVFCGLFTGCSKDEEAKSSTLPPSRLTSLYTLGGSVLGLDGSLAIRLNDFAPLVISQDGNFIFPNQLAEGQKFDVMVASQPDEQACSIAGASGTFGAANINSIQIICSDNQYSVGGILDNYHPPASGGLTLVFNGVDYDDVLVGSNFIFPSTLTHGSPYHVTIKAQRWGQNCTLSGAVGVIESDNIGNLALRCIDNTVMLSGRVSGLQTGSTVTIKEANGAALPLSYQQVFSFPVKQRDGAYSVTIITQPAVNAFGKQQTCTISRSSGPIVLGTPITGVNVYCAPAI